ncbi:uncharacterized protein LOC105836915 [Monomorium pharaonis]|uniref:uncharacterized protein LOC105836915 n=1 Tax=Monomorium pharaonis TaxID=307658 RepID=UPI00063F684A|nr:uncharacterized protein LOC105836915 [Monomorium pharaonis]XP_012536730.1 uncharacterized protein LOC105836915 [Monomorium pharaonis]XP_012536731.1 uncharacterized protein LOC105836915 [Monomorium pharaonis]XP_012536733.1 uncharacterized protein LOC105836915 [Monomorium pharaonis]XP_012536734.1 uncharacterized protein LOC105836915 [Monomorium pharaonis]XP_012536735.1 uncharacterized protein LOC105836915 [Monomorium pharaonis]
MGKKRKHVGICDEGKHDQEKLDKDNYDKEQLEKEKRDKEKDEQELPFGSRKHTLTILNALFNRGHQNVFPEDIIPGISPQEYHSKMNSTFEFTKNVVKDTASIVHWLNNGLFLEDECNIPMALLFIAWYEQHPTPRKNVECDFREVYEFLYKVTTNQPVPYLSENSANVLYELLSDLIDEVWPDTQLELMNFIGHLNLYNRPAARKTYPGKKAKLNSKERTENCSA